MAVNPKSLKNLKPPKKGEVRNPDGIRARVNKVTAETKELIALALNKNLPEMEEAISSLLRSENESTRGRAVELYLRLLEFSTPRLQAMAVKAEGTGTNILVIGKPAELEDTSNSEQDYNSSDSESEDNSDVIDITGESVEE